jgi:hypothetical protein
MHPQHQQRKLVGLALAPLILMSACSNGGPRAANTQTAASTVSTSADSGPTAETTIAAEAKVGADPETSEKLLAHTISTADEGCPNDVPAGSKCGVATVPLDWTNPNGDSIEVWFAIRPAQAQPSTGTFIPFEGGPGGPISASIAITEAFAKH